MGSDLKPGQTIDELISKSVYTGSDIGISDYCVIDPCRDGGYGDDIQKRVSRLEAKPKKKDSQIRKMLFRMAGRSYYEYAKLRDRLGITIESPIFSYWNMPYIRQVVGMVCPGGLAQIREGEYVIGTAGTSGVNQNGNPVKLKTDIGLLGAGAATILKLADYQKKTGTNIASVPATNGVPNIVTNSDWSSVGAQSNIYIGRMTLDGNNANQNQAPTGTEHDNLNLTGVTDFLVENMWCKDAYSDGMDFDYCENGVVKAVLGKNNGGSSFHTSNGGGMSLKPLTETPCKRVKFIECGSQSSGTRMVRPAFLIAGGVSGDRCYHMLSNCHSLEDSRGFEISQGAQYCSLFQCGADNPSAWGIIMASTRGIAAQCMVNNSGKSAVLINNNRNLISGGHYWNSGDNLEAGERAAIKLASGAINCFVYGTYLFDEQSGDNRTQEYGIMEEGTADFNYIFGNRIENNKTKGVLKVGANTKVRNNFGYVTENHGAATILSGQSTVVVTHALSEAPTVIFITGSHAEVKECIATSPGESQFTIDAGGSVTGDRTVYWEARV